MKTLTCVAFCAFVLSTIPLSHLCAQEPVNLTAKVNSVKDIKPEKKIVNGDDTKSHKKNVSKKKHVRFPTVQETRKALASLPIYKDAVKGTISTKIEQDMYYDIYTRQLAYRDGAIEYRKSLDKRRQNFAKPRTKMIGDYKKVRDIIYTAETIEYQKKVNAKYMKNANKKSGTNKIESAKISEAKKLPTGNIASMIKNKGEANQIQLKEQKIPSNEDIRKKVITADNAPEFNPAKLSKQFYVKSAQKDENIEKDTNTNNIKPPQIPKTIKKRKSVKQKETLETNELSKKKESVSDVKETVFKKTDKTTKTEKKESTETVTKHNESINVEKTTNLKKSSVEHAVSDSIDKKAVSILDIKSNNEKKLHSTRDESQLGIKTNGSLSEGVQNPFAEEQDIVNN